MAKKEANDPLVSTPAIQEQMEDHNEAEERIDFPSLIGLGIANCMRERTHHREVEKSLDDWMKGLPQDRQQRIKMVDDMRKQMETARQAMELLYSRFRTLSVNAKG